MTFNQLYNKEIRIISVITIIKAKLPTGYVLTLNIIQKEQRFSFVLPLL